MEPNDSSVARNEQEISDLPQTVDAAGTEDVRGGGVLSPNTRPTTSPFSPDKGTATSGQMSDVNFGGSG